MSSLGRLCLLLALVLAAMSAMAKTPEVVLEIRDHLFHPEEVRIPANTKVKLVVYNRDPTPEEFESYELNREKVIMGGRKANIFIGPLAPGVYPFFGEFNPRTAQGRVVAE